MWDILIQTPQNKRFVLNTARAYKYQDVRDNFAMLLRALRKKASVKIPRRSTGEKKNYRCGKVKFDYVAYLHSNERISHFDCE